MEALLGFGSGHEIYGASVLGLRGMPESPLLISGHRRGAGLDWLKAN
jgi:hypothetical protein